MVAPYVITVENIGMTSFSDMLQALWLAERLGCYVKTTLCGRKVVINGREDPHELYAKLTK